MTQIALSAGCNVSSHSIALRTRHQPTIGSGLVDAYRQQWDQVPVGLLKQSNLDNLNIEQVLCVVPNVVLEQIDPLFDVHRKDLIRLEIRQLGPRLMNCGEFLLLEYLFGYVAEPNNNSIELSTGSPTRFRV